MAKHRQPATGRIGATMNHWLAGREPALLAMLVGIAIKLIAAFWIDINIEQQALLNAAVAAIIGCLVAVVTRNGESAGILGLAQALLALAIGLGLHMAAENQALVMSFVATAVAMYERTQITAPVPPE